MAIDGASKDTKIGWIGTGVMGASMCGHILDAGYPVTVYTRTESKAQDLIERGAVWAESPVAVAESADIVFTIVGFPKDVEEIYFGDEGLLTASNPPSIVVDMTTSPPSLAEKIYIRGREQRIAAIDAPVSGGDVGARNAALSIMIGGDKEDVDAVQPLFDLMGKNNVYQGPAGAGQHTKMCNQIMVSGEMVGMCESLIYGARAGLDLETMLQSVSKGAAACWMLDNLAPRVLKRDFDPGFFAEHFIKDMGIALDEAKRMAIVLPGLALVHQLYLAVQANGHGRLGTQALFLALEQLAGIDKE